MKSNPTKLNARRLSSRIVRGAFSLVSLLLLLLFAFMVVRFTVPKPASPSAFNSPVKTPIAVVTQVTARPEQTRILKPSPTGIELATPEPIDFIPVPGSAPAGAGALVKVQPPFSSIQYHIENTWYKDNDARTRVYVYAGSVPGPGGEYTKQGVLVVQVLQKSLDNNHVSTKMIYSSEHQTPIQSGAIHITGAVGERLILQSTDGAVFYFDVPSRQFVPSLTWISTLPTPSPRPIQP